MWEWRENRKYYSRSIQKLGLSVDWTRTQFTMNPDYQKAVETAFKNTKRRAGFTKANGLLIGVPAVLLLYLILK